MMTLLVDTNVVLDCLLARHPFYDSASMLLCLGKLREVELWMSISQFTDAFYLLSEGGKKHRVHEAKRLLDSMLECVHLCPLAEEHARAALDSTWPDLEDACVYQAALAIKADAIITRNQADFERSSIRVFSCDELFAWLAAERGITYDWLDM